MGVTFQRFGGAQTLPPPLPLPSRGREELAPRHDSQSGKAWPTAMDYREGCRTWRMASLCGFLTVTFRLPSWASGPSAVPITVVCLVTCICGSQATLALQTQYA